MQVTEEFSIPVKKMGRFESFNDNDIYSSLTLDKVKRITKAENNGKDESEFSWKVSYTWSEEKLGKQNIPPLTEFEVWEIAKRYSSGQTTRYIKEYLEQWKNKEMQKRNNNKQLSEYAVSLTVSEQRVKDVIKMIKG